MKGQTRAWSRATARCGLAVLSAVLAGRAGAAMIKVPEDHPTIQAAVNAAAAGDVIWVLQGTYKENVTVKSKVRLEGGWSPTYGARNWNAWPSVIDGDQKGSVVVGADGATLDGFTLRNGMAKWGGGLRLEKGWMTIRNNDIRDNTATSGGGGIFISGHPKAPPYTDIESNVNRRNKVTTDQGGTGGGIHVTRSAAGIRITGNTIGGGIQDGNSARWVAIVNWYTFTKREPAFAVRRSGAFTIARNSLEERARTPTDATSFRYAARRSSIRNATENASTATRGLGRDSRTRWAARVARSIARSADATPPRETTISRARATSSGVVLHPSPSRTRRSSRVARRQAMRSGNVRLPEARSPSADLPVCAGSPARPMTSSRSWKARPARRPARSRPATVAGAAFARSAPHASGAAKL